MSRLVSRILLSIFMFPLAGIFYTFVAVVGMDLLRNNLGFYTNRETVAFTLCGVLTWILVAAYWCLLWKSTVKWTSQRLTHTWFAAGGAVFVAGVIGLFTSAILPRSSASFGMFVAGILAIILWLIATVFLWRESPAERAQRITQSGSSTITCPACGYNLTGLTESRCPECGATFTLDELMASQPNSKVEIE
jgi:hypothetical protein